jgi:hypothetical protein
METPLEVGYLRQKDDTGLTPAELAKSRESWHAFRALTQVEARKASPLWCVTLSTRGFRDARSILTSPQQGFLGEQLLQPHEKARYFQKPRWGKGETVNITAQKPSTTHAHTRTRTRTRAYMDVHAYAFQHMRTRIPASCCVHFEGSNARSLAPMSRLLSPCGSTLPCFCL